MGERKLFQYEQKIKKNSNFLSINFSSNPKRMQSFQRKSRQERHCMVIKTNYIQNRNRRKF